MPRVLPADLVLADPAVLAEVAAVLARGGLVAVPTETVYGLAGDATLEEGVAAIYRAKRRPANNPLILHVASMEAASNLGVLGDPGARLGRAFWPGPLTLVVPRRPGVRIAAAATAGRASVALRVPASPVMAALAGMLGNPIAAPSANRSGRISATTAADVVAELGEAVDVVIDGGSCAVGVESTIVGLLGDAPTLLRPGGVERAAIEAILGLRLARPGDDADRPLAPGRLASHYAPAAAVRLGAGEVRPGEALLTFAGRSLPGAEAAVAVADLSPRGDAIEAARRLYGSLRTLDAVGAAAIAVVPLSAGDVGEAVIDRLARAAAPRPDGGA